MKLKLKLVILFILSTLSISKVESQSSNTGITVKMNGYVVNVGGQILFQPCEDTMVNIWESLDNTSFALWYFREELYLEAIENMGDSVKVYCYDIEEKRKYLVNFSYFYCSLEIDMMFLDTIRFKIYKEPKYEITYNDKIYHMYGFSIDNRIKKLIPYDSKDLLLMYHYYWDKGYRVPEWLAELVECRNKEKK